jgi:hypothetical protein
LYTKNRKAVHRKQKICTQVIEGLYRKQEGCTQESRRNVLYIVPSQEDTCTQETRRLFKGKRRFVLREKKGCTQERGCTQEAGRLYTGKQEECTLYVQCTQAR